MATLALSVAGQFAGGLIGGPLGAMAGRALGAMAGSAIDNALFGAEPDAAAPPPFTLQGSSEGGVIPRIYGWNRVAGNIIWATSLERLSVQSAGSKGDNNNSDQEEIVANFAVGLCEGEVALLGRIWADGRLLETENITLRFHTGSQSQNPDPLIELKQGTGNTPSYRGLCYLVFEGLALKQFGNRIPNISVEICRVAGDLEPAIKAITIIPGSTEFGYDPEPRVQIVSVGTTRSENTNLLGQTSDWTISIDQLQALCPNLEHVALVVSWFGDDLRCSRCKVQPRVENSTKTISDASWLVSGNTRIQVPVVTQYQGGPAYGGTPSDASVLAAIADLKARGIKVTLYPFVLMDISNSNSLNDPYSGNVGQSAYPWRGRITSDPAPAQSGTPDKTGAMNTQVNSFVGGAKVADFSATGSTINYNGAADWGYRRMILHYAHLAQLAGGVDAILIGSELRGLTWLRNSATGFPFVDELVNLASDVRSVVGSGTKISYGADWSEYSGYQPLDAPGDKLFHLDPLWSSPSIDAIGVDNYMPLSDWRGNGDEPDAEIANHLHQLDYLQANIAAGEGFDWYYASQSDRTNASRTPITDGVDAEPWIWRVKDIKSWWSNPHHNRVAGTRDPVPTSWVPQSKPIWLTELGCGAVDKGSNTPNVFGDAKSVENALPYFSDGTADALIQRQFLRAHHHWWQQGSPGYDPQNNPPSNQFSGQMLDPERIYVWTWDARPYPAFPNRTDVWSDGKNHKIGHWLTGRLGDLSGTELLAAMANDYDFSFFDLNVAPPQIDGAQITGAISLRRAIEPLLGATGLSVRDTPDGVSIINPVQTANIALTGQQFVLSDAAVITRNSANKHEAIGQLALNYLDRHSDYRPATQIAVSDLNPVQTGVTTNLVLNSVSARRAVQTMISDRQVSDSIEIDLPPSALALEVGDMINADVLGADDFAITVIKQGATQKLSAVEKNTKASIPIDADLNIPAIQLPKITAIPEIVVAHIPGSGGDIAGTDAMLAAFADPWPSQVFIVNDGTAQIISTLGQPAVIGNLLQILPAARTELWDHANQIQISTFTGHLSSVSELQALNGANRLAVQKDDGNWEVIGFANAEMIGVGQYGLSSLLRGQNATIAASKTSAAFGNRVVLFDAAVQNLTISNEQLESALEFTSFAGSTDLIGTSAVFPLNADLAKPLSPVHLSAQKIIGGDDILIRWKRVSQIGGDSWVGAEIPLDFTPEEYQMSIFDGATMVRQLSISTSQAIYSSADQIADFGSVLPDFTYSISQVSAVHGPGNSTTGGFPL